MEAEPQPKQEWGIFNCLFPFIAIATLIMGWRIGIPHGWIWGFVGGIVGLVAAVPAVGLIGLALFAIAFATGQLGDKKKNI